MSRQVISRNAYFSVSQVVITGIILFILYRFLLDAIGVELLGVWSLILASVSVSTIGQLGISGSVVKYVAKYLAHGEFKSTIKIIETAAVSIGFIIGVIMLIIYYPLILLLGFFLPESVMPVALSILPYAMVSLWVTSITSVYRSGLDGCQRIDLRAMTTIGGSFLNLTMVIILVPLNGIIGVAYAQIIQSGFMFIISSFFLSRELPGLPSLPIHWDLSIFREMIWYGINFQFVSIMVMLFDPLTKLLLSKFGSLEMVGYYEMANRMIMQFRGLLVSANQVLVPVIATYKELSPERIRKVYFNTYRLVVYLSLLLYGAILTIIPLISVIWIGKYEPVFVVFSSIMAVAWFLNTLSVPAYFNNQGTGQLRWNTIAHVITSISNLSFGVFFGILYRGLGVVAATALSLIIGSFVLIIAYHKEHKIKIRNLFPKEIHALALVVCIGVSYGWLLYFNFQHELSTLTLTAVIVVGFMLLVAIPAWSHPMRHRIIN